MKEFEILDTSESVINPIQSVDFTLPDIDSDKTASDDAADKTKEENFPNQQD